MTSEVLNLFDSGGESRFYISRDLALNLISRGCVMCHCSFDSLASIDLDYDRTELYSIGATPTEVAEWRLTTILHPFFGAREDRVLIIDQKAAVCLKCWTEFLRQVVALKGMAT